jgi:holo-[acyl-carrier protein] synthase
MSEVATTGELKLALEAATTQVLGVASVGLDAVHIPTWERYLKLGGPSLLERTYQRRELLFCAGRTDRLSSRLAGKEAVLKALGTGIRGIALSEVEIRSEPDGKPIVVLHGSASTRADELGIVGMEISLCHEQGFAFAVAVGIGVRDE